MLSSKSNNHRYLSLIALKDQGGLVYPPESVLKVISLCERVFKQFVSGSTGIYQINSSRNLLLKLISKVVAELSQSSIFPRLVRHDVENSNINEDFHSTQIIKALSRKFFTTRLLRYGQEYTQAVLKKDAIGKRQQLKKLILFKGL